MRKFGKKRKFGKNYLVAGMPALIVLFSVVSIQAQEYEFQFVTSAPGFSAELFFNAPSGSGTGTEGLEPGSFVTTPDGTFTLSGSVVGGPVGGPQPVIAWTSDGIDALGLSLYENHNSQLYNWTATPTTIADAQVGGIPFDPSASGTWVYAGAVPEPGVRLLMVLGLAAMLVRPSVARNSEEGG